MDLITVKEAAALLGIKPEQLYIWHYKFPKRIKRYEFGEGKRPTIRYDRQDILDYISSCSTATESVE